MAEVILSQQTNAANIEDEGWRYRIMQSIEISFRHVINLGHYQTIIELAGVSSVISSRNPMKRSIKPTPQQRASALSRLALETARTEPLAQVALFLDKATAGPGDEPGIGSLHCHELHSALKDLEENSEAIIKLLLAEERNFDAQDCHGHTPLFHSIKVRNDTITKELLKCTDPNIADNNGQTPLHFVAGQTDYRNSNVATMLLWEGANCNAQDKSGSSPLHLLMKYFGHGSDEMIELLLNWGANTMIRDQTGRTPLHYAGYCNPANTAVIGLLLSHKADINSLDNHNRTPLHLALGEIRNLTAATTLLNQGANVNTQDSFKFSPLHSALECLEAGLEDVTKLLVAKGADVNKKDRNNRTPLHTAIDRGHETVIEYLLDKGADVHALDKNLKTPLHLATSGAGTIATATALLKRGANVNALDSLRSSPLHSAARFLGRDSGSMIKLLLAYGADFNAQDECDRTPLHEAANAAGLDAITILLAAGANINTLDTSYSTPLHLAFRLVGMGDSEKIIRLLLAKGASAVVNAEDQNSFRPLHLAVYQESPILVNLLLVNGADIDAMNKYGETALDIAAKIRPPGSTNTVVATLLKRKGARHGSEIAPETSELGAARKEMLRETAVEGVAGATSKGFSPDEEWTLKRRNLSPGRLSHIPSK